MSRIFVYGTLRKGMYNYDIYLKQHQTYVQNAYVKGHLFSIKGVPYPALLQGNEMVLGEIHEVPDEVLKEVDAMEGYIEAEHIDNEYNKEICTVYDKEGTIIDYLPVYMYNIKNPRNQQLVDKAIVSNDYVTYINQQKELTTKS